MVSGIGSALRPSSHERISSSRPASGSSTRSTIHSPARPASSSVSCALVGQPHHFVAWDDRAGRTAPGGRACRVRSRYARRRRCRRHADAARLELLMDREHDVLRLMARGATNAEIAASLYVAEATVKSHVGSIFTKLDVRDRAAAIVFAYDHGVVSPGSAPTSLDR